MTELASGHEQSTWAVSPAGLEMVRVSLTAPMQALTRPAVQPRMLSPTLAAVPVRGVLTKRARWWSTGTDEIGTAIDAALAQPRIRRLALHIESPGGEVAGISELAERIRAARKKVEVVAVVDDVAASGAYWLASQADRIVANPAAQVGSIGVYSVVVDASQALERAGLAVHVIRSGPHKGAGIDGLTEDQRAGMQTVVDGLAEQFVAAVARGRGRSRSDVSEWATGAVWLAAEAKAMGLIDDIGSMHEEEKRDMRDQEMEQEAKRASAELVATAQAQAVAEERVRVAALIQAFGADQDFARSAIERGISVTEAKAEFCDVLTARLAKQAKEAQASAGARPVVSAGEGTPTMTSLYQRAREESVRTGRSYRECMAALAREDQDTYLAQRGQTVRS